MPSEARHRPPGPPGGHGAAGDAEGIGPPTGLLAEFPALMRVERWLALAPAAILFAMMAITFANVFLRYLFRAPLSGALEILSYMMGVLVFVSLPLVALRGEHVRVGLIDTVLPGWLRRLRGVVFHLIMAGVAAALGWRMWLFAARLEGWDEKTQQYGMPLWTLAQMFALSCAVMALIHLAVAWRATLNRDFVNRMDV